MTGRAMADNLDEWAERSTERWPRAADQWCYLDVMADG